VSADPPVPLYDDSRRLFGPSLWLDGPGVVLEASLHPAHAAAETDRWRERVTALTGAVGWGGTPTARRDGTRAMLAFPAPVDLLLAATLVNEWAWIGAATDGERRAHAEPSDAERLPPALPDATAALRARIADEARPALRTLAARAAERGVPLLLDDDEVSLGYGRRARCWPAAAVPDPDEVPWAELGAIPVALVTGSNGKTTTVRLVAAMLARAGHRVGYCCSDGVFIAGEQVEVGDWSGPAGARRVLRDPAVTAAVLETARGGLLRRGLVVPQARAAIVTNLAADHFGEYGVRTREALAEVKLGVARALGGDGTLVLNGEDAVLRDAVAGGAGAAATAGRVEWFSAGTPPAVVPAAEEMPLTLGGAARYNVMNAIGAAYVARALGVPDADITATLRDFGRDRADNPGRLERFEVGGVRVWLDYAHNPHGLAALLAAARAAGPQGRLGLLLGQAGDRQDDAIRALARAAWAAAPDHVVLKDLDGYLRGRAPGEVPALLRDELRRAGATDAQLETAADETDGVRRLLAWARPGDLLVLPVHALEARERAKALLREDRGRA
jgi:cyanophycin synthetase